MVNLFKLNQRKKLAKKQKIAQVNHAGETFKKTDQTYNALMAKLQADKRNLKSIRSRELVAQYRTAEIEPYLDYLNGVVEEDLGGPCYILAEIIVWVCDLYKTEEILTLGKYAIRHDVPMPANFKRPIHEFIVEAIADNWNEYRHDEYEQFVEAFIQDGMDIKDIPLAKFYRGAGDVIERDYPEEALTEALLSKMVGYWSRAYELNESIGVKTKLTNAQKQLEQLTPPSTETKQGDPA